MKITKRQLQAIKFSSPDETRVALQSLHLKGNEVRATDGHKAAFVRAPKEIDNKRVKSLLIAGEQVKQLPKMMPTKKHDLLEWHVVEIDKETISSNLHNFNMKTQVIEGKFPNLDQVLPSEDDRPVKIGLNPAYLRDICDYIAKGQSNYEPQLCIHLAQNATDENSALITATDADGHELKFVLMPSKL